MKEIIHVWCIQISASGSVFFGKGCSNLGMEKIINTPDLGAGGREFELSWPEASELMR